MKTIKISTYPLKLKSFDGQKLVFDQIRQKYVVFTPEEFVRQNMISYLIHEKKYRKNLMAVEYSVKHMNTVLRSDIVVFDKELQPIIIIECKAPKVRISQSTIDQAVVYNGHLKVKYLIVSNGNVTYCCKMDYINNSYDFIQNIPDFEAISH